MTRNISSSSSAGLSRPPDAAARAATPVTLATWAFTLHRAGFPAVDHEIREACEAVAAAGDPETGDLAAQELVARVRSRLDDVDGPSVLALARRVWGDSISGDLGEADREERAQRIRRYEFERGLPWLARIWERDGAGMVRPGWLVVERVTDRVSVMDPNPWDEIEERRELPVDAFHALWELEGCPSVRLR